MDNPVLPGHDKPDYAIHRNQYLHISISFSNFVTIHHFSRGLCNLSVQSSSIMYSNWLFTGTKIINKNIMNRFSKLDFDLTSHMEWKRNHKQKHHEQIKQVSRFFFLHLGSSNCLDEFLEFFHVSKRIVFIYVYVNMNLIYLSLILDEVVLWVRINYILNCLASERTHLSLFCLCLILHKILGRIGVISRWYMKRSINPKGMYCIVHHFGVSFYRADKAMCSLTLFKKF